MGFMMVIFIEQRTTRSSILYVCRKNQTPIKIRTVFHKNQRSNDNLLKYIEKLVKLNLSNIMPLILIRPLEVRGCLAILMVAYPHDGLPAGIEGLGDR